MLQGWLNNWVGSVPIAQAWIRTRARAFVVRNANYFTMGALQLYHIWMLAYSFLGDTVSVFSIALFYVTETNQELRHIFTSNLLNASFKHYQQQKLLLLSL